MSSYQQGKSGGGSSSGGGGGSSNNSNNNNNNSNDYSKKDEFRKYLEKTGVLDAFTKVLVGLYEEPEPRPNNAIEYIKKYLNAPPNIDIDSIKRENTSLKLEVERLKRQLQREQQSQSNQQSNHNSNNNNNNGK